MILKRLFLKDLNISKIFISTVLLVLCSNQNIAQIIEKQWEKKVPTEKVSHACIRNLEGNLVFVGTTDSNKSKEVRFIIRNTLGNILKDTTIIGGTKDDGANAICNTHDGGFLIAGYTESSKKGYVGNGDAWVVKTDFNGKPIWEKVVGTPEKDIFETVTEDNKGNFYMAGSSGQALYVVKLNAHGDLVWTKNIKGSERFTRQGRSIAFSQKTGLIVIGGYEQKNNDPIFENLYLTGLDETGNIVFDTKSANAAAEKLIEMPNGNWLLAGWQYKDKSDDKDMLLMQADTKGTILLSKTFGGKFDDVAEAMAFDPISRTVWLAGKTYSQSEKKSHKSQLKLLKSDLQGNKLWEQNYGDDTSNESVYDLLLSEEGQLIATGYGKADLTAWLLSFSTVVDSKNTQNTEALSIEKGLFKTLDTLKSVFKPEEKGFYEFIVKNNGTTPISTLTAQVIPLTKTIEGLWILPKIHIEQLMPNESRVVAIPFDIGDKAMNDTADFKVHFFVGNKEIKEAIVFQIVTQAPKLEIIERSYTRDSSHNITLKLAIKNTGKLKAEQVEMSFICPQDMTYNTQSFIEWGNIEAGSIQKATFSFQPQSTFKDNVALIKIQVSEKTRKGGIKEKIPIEIGHLQETSVPLNESYLKMTLVQPYSAQNNGSTEVTINKTELDLNIQLLSDKAIVDSNITIYINDRILKGEKSRITPLSCNDKNNKWECVFKKTISIANGVKDTIEVKAKNTSGEANIRIIANCKIEKPNLHILALGVPYSDLSLTYTPKDANDFVQIWDTQEGHFFDKVFVRKCNTKTSTTASAIQDTIKTLTDDFFKTHNILPRDYLIVYISSHGFLGYKKRFYIGDSDYSPTVEKGINFEIEVLEKLSTINCKQLYLIDACYSGKAVIEGQEFAKETKPSNGLILVSSCKESETSFENKDLENGLFTKAILETIVNQKQSDKDNNNVLTIGEFLYSLKTEGKKIKGQTLQSYIDREKDNESIIYNFNR